MPQTKRGPRKRAIAAIRAGNVAFAVPEAAACMPTRAGKPPKITATGFEYVKARITQGCIVFSWGYPGVGFGEVWLGEQNGKWQADTEYMGPDFCAKMLEAWIRGDRPCHQVSCALSGLSSGGHGNHTSNPATHCWIKRVIVRIDLPESEVEW